MKEGLFRLASGVVPGRGTIRVVLQGACHGFTSKQEGYAGRRTKRKRERTICLALGHLPLAAGGGILRMSEAKGEVG